jgi:hypothetical protein
MLYSLVVAADNIYFNKHVRDYEYYKTIDCVDIYVARTQRMKDEFEDEENLAFTLGVRIYAKSKRILTKKVIAHEMTHIRQAKDSGIIFTWSYLLSDWWYGYDDNPYEVEARQSERNR